MKTGPETCDLFAFLTCEPNGVVAPIHPKAMPVILTTEEERDVWMRCHGRRRLRCSGRWRMMRWSSRPWLRGRAISRL
jgi:putative SOS response-associated peptidase YedK